MAKPRGPVVSGQKVTKDPHLQFPLPGSPTTTVSAPTRPEPGRRSRHLEDGSAQTQNWVPVTEIW